MGHFEVQGQFTGDLRPIEGDVQSVMMKHVNRKHTTKGKSFALYNKESLVISEGRIYKGDTIIERSFKYDWSDPKSCITRYIQGPNSISMFVIKRDHQGRYLKTEMFWEGDPEVPLHSDNEFIYNDKGQLSSFVRTTSFKSTTLNPNERRTRKKCIELRFENTRVVEEIERDSCDVTSQRRFFEYDSLGNKIKETIDSMDPNSHVFGGRSENGIQRYFYKFDKEGNWIKRYFEFESGKRILEIKRKIKYRKKSA